MPLKVGFDLIALPEAESGPRVENFISEDDRFVEHDERKIGAGDGSTDTSSSSVWQRDIRRSQIPVLPGTSLGSPGLEHEPTASTQDVNDGSQRAVPVLVRHEHLRHIAGHHDEVCLRPRLQRSGVPDHPRDPLGPCLGSSNVDRGCDGVHSHDLHSMVRQHEREATRPTAHVNDAPGRDIPGDRDICLQITSVRIEKVIQHRLCGISKRCIWRSHEPKVEDPCRQRR